MHRFFHADRSRSLKEGQAILLNEKNLSYFGAVYWDAITTKDQKNMTSAELREYHLENVRQEPKFSNYTSRMQSMFAANSIDEAIWFANSVEPKPEYDIPIIEIYASKFWTLDMNWLDYDTSAEMQLNYYREYWHAAISNHCPPHGDRRPPRLEVLIALPAKAGSIVAYA